MYSKDSHSASHLGNTNPCMDDFDIDSFISTVLEIKMQRLKEVRASQLTWARVVSLKYIGRPVPSQYPTQLN